MAERCLHPYHLPGFTIGGLSHLMTNTSLPLARIREIEQTGLRAGLPLMQLAGTAIAQFVLNVIQPKGNILVLAGPGNNGGDALVAATALRQAGRLIDVWMPITTNLPADAEHALQVWFKQGGQMIEQLPDQKPALVLDGLFGIGLNRPLGSPWQDTIDAVNQWGVPVLAIDIPSGLEADTGKHLGRPIRATWTLSFIAPTQALFSQSGRALAGEILVEQLGLDGLGMALPQPTRSGA